MSLVFKKGDKVTYRGIFGEEYKIIVDDYSGFSIGKFEEDGSKVLKIERPKFETIYEFKEILDKKEKEYLSYVIKPFRNRIKNISKKEYYSDGKEWLCVRLKNNDRLVFPNFKKNTMYKGMEIDKGYTLEELGL